MSIPTVRRPRRFAGATSFCRSTAGRCRARQKPDASWRRWRRGTSRRSCSGAERVKSSSPSGKTEPADFSLPIADVIRERGPMTVAAFMDLALYDSEMGYYARAPRRSGRAGDFFTSVDVGAIFGELLAIQLAEMSGLLESPIPDP